MKNKYWYMVCDTSKPYENLLWCGASRKVAYELLRILNYKNEAAFAPLKYAKLYVYIINDNEPNKLIREVK